MAAILIAATIPTAAGGSSRHSKACSRTVLYAWAGPEPAGEFTPVSAAGDVLATIDATLGSKKFGTVVSTTLTGTTGAEPHHMGLSADKKTLATGGLLSFLSGLPDIYLFEVGTNPLAPTLKSTITATEGGGTDAFVPLPGGGFLTTLMTNRQGGASGRIGKIDAAGSLVAEVAPPDDQSPEKYNPHGIAYSTKYDRLVTVDFVELASLIVGNGPPAFKQTIRIYRLSTLTMLKTIELEGALAIMDVVSLSFTKGLFMTSNGFGKFYIVDSLALTVSDQPVFELAPENIPGHCLFHPLANGRKMLIVTYGLSQLLLVDMSSPYNAKELQRYQMELQPEDVGYTAAPGPHFVTATPDEKVVAVSNYFVQNPATIVVEQNGFYADKTIRFFTLAANKKSFKPHAKVPVLDFRRLVGARPHGMAFKTFRGRTNADGECVN
jgi:selenium-binding protein 1